MTIKIQKRKTMRAIKPGFYAGINNETYHQGMGISSSQVKTFLDVPAKFKAQVIDGNVKEIGTVQQANFDFGTLVHTLVLEPDMFEKDFVITPAGSKATKEYKAFAKAEKEGLNRIMITHAILEKANMMKQSLLDHPQGYLFTDTTNELSVISKHKGTGLLVKCRPDALKAGYYCLDIKTCVDASADGFSKSIANFNYHISAGMYLDILEQEGCKVDTFIFACVEKEPPYLCAFYALSESEIQAGKDAYNSAMADIQFSSVTNDYSGYNQNQLVEIERPGWSKNKAVEL